MGDKNIDFGGGTLYIEGVKLCNVEEVEEFESEANSFADDIDYLKLMVGYARNPMTFSATCTVSYDLFLRVTKSNNWLRMHGYPIRRKVRYKRGKYLGSYCKRVHQALCEQRNKIYYNQLSKLWGGY